MKKTFIVVLGLLTVTTVGGCSGYNETRGRGDAPVGHRDDGPAEVINMPDKFGNVALKCDGHGHRIYVVTHGRTDAPATVIDDPECPGGAGR